MAAHALGVACERVECDRSSARVTGAGLVQLRGAWVPTRQPYSYQESVIIMLAGRVEDERRGYFPPFFVAPPSSDEGGALSAALGLAHGDAVVASRVLVSACSEAKRILDERQPEVAAVAAALVERDLDAADMVRILGPLPPPSATRNVDRRDGFMRVDALSVLECTRAMMDGHPFALALIFFSSTVPVLAWLDMDGELMPPVTVDTPR